MPVRVSPLAMECELVWDWFLRPVGRGESRSWVFNPHPTKRGSTAIPSWISLAAPNGVESPLCSLANLLSLPKDASLHLRKLARHLIGRMPECRDVYGCTITTMARLTQFAYSPCGNAEGMVYTCGSGVIGRLLKYQNVLV